MQRFALRISSGTERTLLVSVLCYWLTDTMTERISSMNFFKTLKMRSDGEPAGPALESSSSSYMAVNSAFLITASRSTIQMFEGSSLSQKVPKVKQTSADLVSDSNLCMPNHGGRDGESDGVESGGGEAASAGSDDGVALGQEGGEQGAGSGQHLEAVLAGPGGNAENQLVTVGTADQRSARLWCAPPPSFCRCQPCRRL